MYIDLRYQTRRKQARCVVDLSDVANELTESSEEITDDQAHACRREILSSRVWGSLGCPNN